MASERRGDAPNPERPTTLPSRRGGLGRGLDALIPTLGETATAATQEIDIDAIAPNPYQPRVEMDREALETLAASIRVHGIIQPLVLTYGPERGRYVLIAGERRWRAARLAGLGAVPAVIKEAAPRAMLELALVENVVRADLSALEEAAAYRQLIDDFGLTQAAVAERVGRSRVSVTNTLRLLALPDRVQRALAAGEISEGHARALLGLPAAAEQITALDDIQARGLSVRQTEELVRRWVAEGAPSDVPKREVEGGGREEALRLAFVDGLQRAIGTRVGFRPDKTGGGTLTIHFGSDEALNAFYARLAGEETW
jgi:ParB family chromosome partitioning protein